MIDKTTLKAIATLRRKINSTERKQLNVAFKLKKARVDLTGRKRKAGAGQASPATGTSGRVAVDMDLSSAAIALSNQISGLEVARTNFIDQRAELREQLGDLLDRLAIKTPQEMAATLNVRVPVVFFPTKLETRFFKKGRVNELRVRVFPDQVMISALQEAISEAETVEAHRFWKSMAEARQVADPVARQVLEQAAATTFGRRTTGQRTLWVALQTRPENWPADMDDTAPLGNDLEFPKRLPTPTNSAAAVRILPDRFVFELHRGGKIIHTKTGFVIKDTLMMAPDGDGETATIERDKDQGTIKPSANLRWLFDYDAAVAEGMAVTIPITAGDRRTGFDKVLVMGVRYSDSASQSATLLEEHFKALRFSTGLDVVTQGTPTNNTDEVKSGFSSGEVIGTQDVLRLAAGQQQASAITSHRHKTDGQRLAEAIGIDPQTTFTWSNGHASDISEALAMNRALWPATLGGYMRDFLSPLSGGAATAASDAALTRRITRFANDYVTGRGLVPTIRVGKQPYGVLITSHFDQFTHDTSPTRMRRSVFPSKIRPLLDRFTKVFRKFENRLMAIGQDGDPQEILTNILGLHASSVIYHSRKGVSDAVSWNNLRMLKFDSDIVEAVFDFLNGIRSFALRNIDLDGGQEIAEIVFMHKTDFLDGPIVDGDPDIPLSELAAIQPFARDQNYIGWLLESSADDIRAQKFVDKDGKQISRPRALLYQYLRHAFLAELGEQSANLATQIGGNSIKRQRSNSSLIGVDRKLKEQSFPNDAATVLKTKNFGINTKEVNIGNYLLTEARKRTTVGDRSIRVFAGRMREHRKALASLKGLPTARLERLFAEHMDTCSYRLDAWHSGMFASRLTEMRSRTRESRGLFIAAYGYVENLRARPVPTQVPAGKIPSGLLPADGGKVVSRPDNGGFVHAPSQAHAVTAAVLRNGYLSYAHKTEKERFSINLDSERVRGAMAIVEGLRANQSLGALLGYRLERGLHEGYPGLELDVQIYTLRARFPLTSKRTTPVEAGVSAEVMEARNVVDGYDLIEQARDRSYPWGVSGLPSAGSKAGKAIRAEVDKLEDIFDAYGDLMMAETVHQAVNGSVARARGVIQSIAEGDVPPIPEVVQTPRSGSVISQTIIAEFPDAAHWGTPSARSLVNSRMNGWLVQRLPDPSKVAVSFRLGSGAVKFMRLDKAGIDAIDAVLMAGENQGAGVTVLERWLADRWRATNAVDPSVILSHREGPAVGGDAGDVLLEMDVGAAPVGSHSLDDILPLLLSLQRIITKSRPVHALDYRVSTELELASPSNPKGLRLSAGEPQVRSRVVLASSEFESLALELEVLVTSPASVAIFDALGADEASFELSDWEGRVGDLRNVMRRLWLFGFTQAAPQAAHGVNVRIVRGLFEQGLNLLLSLKAHRGGVVRALEPVLDEVAGGAEGSAFAQLIARRAKALDDACSAMFTKSFRLQHDYALEAEQRTEIQPALDTPIVTDPLELDLWLQGLVRVRKPLDDISIISDWGEWMGAGRPSLTPVQLPRVAGDPWIGGEWEADDDVHDRLGLMLIDAPSSATGIRAGLLIDGFTETVPTSSEITGVSFHYDRPNAEAPQAILVAVPPSLRKGWSWDVLRGSIFDTFDRARLRAVEPDHLLGTNYFQALPANLVPFSRGFYLSTFLASNSAFLATKLNDEE